MDSWTRLLLEMYEFYAYFSRCIEYPVFFVKLPVIYLFYARIGHHFEAAPAGGSCYIYLRSGDPHSIFCRLQYGICFCVNCSNAMFIFYHMTGLVTMRHSADAPVITRRKYGLILYYNCAYIFPVTSTSCGDLTGDIHEICFPACSYHLSNFPLPDIIMLLYKYGL
jgi:hypothetical protein